MKKELKIGIFVVSVIVASFFVLNYLRGEDIFNREYKLMSRYDNVEGLVASSPVYIKGFKAGKVIDVSYDTDKGDFVVKCSVSRILLFRLIQRCLFTGLISWGPKV